MPYYDIVNQVTVTKMNMIDEMPRENTAPSLPQSHAEVSAALEVSRSPVQMSQLLQKSSIL